MRLTSAQMGLLCDIGLDGPGVRRPGGVTSGSGLRFQCRTADALEMAGLVYYEPMSDYTYSITLSGRGTARYEAWKARKRRYLVGK